MVLETFSVKVRPVSRDASQETSLDVSDGAEASFTTPPRQAHTRLRILFKDLSYTVDSNGKRGQKVQLLKGVSGYFEPSQMTAVMGPSGSGKTTFLDLLSGRKTLGAISGTLLFGTTAPTRALQRRHTGYVEQFDTLVDTLTVYEMLLYTAELKRPLSESLESKKAAVESLLAKLALEKCRDVRIGSPLKRGISGGQAKRTNVGIALITTPAVLFLDEPTSGLDSFTSLEVMTVVRSLAADGTTICATIHSPSSACFALFDVVMVLASGWTVYLGAPGVVASDYLSGVCGHRHLAHGENLAEWMLDYFTQADREGRSSTLHEAFQKSKLAQDAWTALDRYLEEADRERALNRGLVTASSKRCRLFAPGRPKDAATPTSSPARGAAVDTPTTTADGGGGGKDLMNTPTTTADGGGGGKDPMNTPTTTADGGGGGIDPATNTHSGGGLGSGTSEAVSSSFLDLALGRLSGGEQYVTPWWWSLKVLLQYRTLRNYQCMEYLGPRLFDKIIFALVIMSLYFGIGDEFTAQNVPSMAALMYLCVAQPAWGAVAYVPNIMMERGLYVRERHDGLYRPATYLLFKMVDELALNFAVGLGSTAIIFFGVQLQGSFAYFWLNCMCTLSNGILIAYMVAALSPNLDVANAAVPTLLAIMLFLSGFLIRVESIPVYWRWLTYADLLKYSWHGLMINQFQEHPDAEFGGNRILEYYNLTDTNKWLQLVILAGFFAAWSLLAWYALAFIRHQKR